MTSVPGSRRHFIRYGSPSRFTSATMPKMPCSGLIARMVPSSAIHIWARSSPTKSVPAMAVVVLPQPLGAAPANQVISPVALDAGDEHVLGELLAPPK